MNSSSRKTTRLQSLCLKWVLGPKRFKKSVACGDHGTSGFSVQTEERREEWGNKSLAGTLLLQIWRLQKGIRGRCQESSVGVFRHSICLNWRAFDFNYDFSCMLHWSKFYFLMNLVSSTFLVIFSHERFKPCTTFSTSIYLLNLAIQPIGRWFWSLSW